MKNCIIFMGFAATMKYETHDTGYVSLFGNFFRLGLTAFGGPAMIPFVRKLAITKMHWVDDADFRIGLAICQAIPGATVMQLAGYIGLRIRGVAGAIAAFCGFGLPAFLLITILSAVYFKFYNLPFVLSVFSGLKAIVLAILFSASIDFVRKYIHSLPDKLISFGAALAFLADIHPVAVIILATSIGVAFFKNDSGLFLQNECKFMSRYRFREAVIVTALFPLALLGLWLLKKDLYHLATLMMGIDVLAFGGGFAALPIMLHEVVIRMGWLTQRVFMDGIALGQITPGPIVITSAFVGYSLAGLAGALTGAVAMFSPSFLIMIWSVPFCDKLLGSQYFRRGLRASLATLAGLMVAVTASFVLSMTWTPRSVVLGAVAYIALRRQIDVFWVVVVGAAMSFVLF
ncbi:chromate efflux transporter [Solidesulfovibrio alcoholivorans]|uniref:chromate efflux transporter n=1 Tax=Solidesulfovibrio alcoholivorans TaxID=81406 RepID=UPI0009FE3ED7|nr:chromate efflux transporter [Solidesulfovibrio alcoholivorans]